MDARREIDALFEPTRPPRDSTGCLAHLLEHVGAERIAHLTVLDADGQGLCCEPELDDATAARIRRQAPVWLAKPTPEPDDPTELLLPLHPAGEEPIWLYAATRGPCDRAAVRVALTQFPSLARTAAQFAQMVQTRRELETRIRHMAAEQLSLRKAHDSTIADVLEAREEVLRAKRKHIQELEEQVHRRSAALREALVRAEEASQAKSDFLANMSHEIRTPMTAVLGFAENLLDDALSESERRNAIETILSNGRQLLEIVNDVLDLAKIEAGRLECERIPCDPRQVLLDVLSLLRNQTAARNLAFEADIAPDVPPLVLTDPTRLRQILMNLASNALKFTHAGGVYLRMHIESTLAVNEARQLVVSIRDTGIGIAPQHLARLFQPFTQSDTSTTRKYGGTGLGLTISRRFARMLGGDIFVESVFGQGSTFTVRIDAGDAATLRALAACNPAAAEVLASGGEASCKLDGVHVLLVEDGPDNRRLISYILRKAGATLSVADNGQSGVDEFERLLALGCAPHILLLDMQMPVMDGYTAARYLRQQGHRVPIVALTADAMSSHRERCLAAGCDRFATKPIDRKALLECIAQLIAERRGAPGASSRTPCAPPAPERS